MRKEESTQCRIRNYENFWKWKKQSWICVTIFCVLALVGVIWHLIVWWRMTPSPVNNKVKSLTTSTPNGNSQRPKFLLSVNGASDSSEPSSPPGESFSIVYEWFQGRNDSILCGIYDKCHFSGFRASPSSLTMIQLNLKRPLRLVMQFSMNIIISLFKHPSKHLLISLRRVEIEK